MNNIPTPEQSALLDCRSPYVKSMDEARESATKHIRKKTRQIDESALSAFLTIAREIEKHRTFDLSSFTYRAKFYDCDPATINKYFISYVTELERLGKIAAIDNPANTFTLYAWV